MRTAPAQHVGSCKLSVFHVAVRIKAHGRVSWSFEHPIEHGTQLLGNLGIPMTEFQPEMLVYVEEAFQVALAARALKGQPEKLRSSTMSKPCTRCPPVVGERIYRVKADSDGYKAYRDGWHHSAYQLEAFKKEHSWVTMDRRNGELPLP